MRQALGADVAVGPDGPPNLGRTAERLSSILNTAQSLAILADSCAGHLAGSAPTDASTDRPPTHAGILYAMDDTLDCVEAALAHLSGSLNRLSTNLGVPRAERVGIGADAPSGLREYRGAR